MSRFVLEVNHFTVAWLSTLTTTCKPSLAQHSVPVCPKTIIMLSQKIRQSDDNPAEVSEPVPQAVESSTYIEAMLPASPSVTGKVFDQVVRHIHALSTYDVDRKVQMQEGTSQCIERQNLPG